MAAVSDDLATVGVTVYFGLMSTGGDFFTLNDPVKGVLNNVTYGLAGDVGFNLANNDDILAVNVSRGRSRALDTFEVGTCAVDLDNLDRLYDGTYTSSPYFGETVPGKRVEVTIWGQTVFSGTIEDWNLEWADDLARASFNAVDGLGDLGRREFDEWTTVGGQLPGARLAAILDRPEVGYGINRDFDAGVSTLTSDLVTWGSEVLAYAQLVAQSDAGRLYVTRNGTLRFQDRLSLVNATPVVAFRDDGTEVSFDTIRTETGSELLFNRVGVDRVGGILQTAEDVDSQNEFGLRPLNISGLLLNSDSDAKSLAWWLLNLYKTPMTRIAGLTVVTNHLPSTQRGAVTGLDIGDVVSVSWRPRNIGNTLDQTLVIDNVSHSVAGPGIHEVSFSFAPLEQQGVFVLNDAILGRLGTGGVLAY